MWRFGLALALIMLVVAAVLWRSGETRRGGSDLQAAEPGSAPSEPEAARLAATQESPAEVRAPVVEDRVEEDELPELHIDLQDDGEDDAEEEDTLPLAGTIVVVDENGVRHETEDGSFQLVCWRDRTGKHQDVEVHGGRWDTRIPAHCESLSVSEIELAERAAVWEGDSERMLAVPSAGWLELLARWPPDSILHVRDRISGRELAPVLVVTIDDWLMGEFGHPCIKAAAARDLGPSPVTLPRNTLREGPNPLFARSPGYAWGRIEIDQARGGERFLLLDQAGELEVEIVGTVSDLGAKLRLYSSEFTPIFEQEIVGATRVSIEDIAPGSYRVAAEIDAHAGTNEVVLRLTPLTGLTLVLRDGTTEIPWSDSMEATLVPTEGQEQYESTRWDNGSITFLRKAPGAYELRIATIPGYEPIAPIAVRLAKAVVGRQVVELVRVR